MRIAGRWRVEQLVGGDRGGRRLLPRQVPCSRARLRHGGRLRIIRRLSCLSLRARHQRHRRRPLGSTAAGPCAVRGLCWRGGHAAPEGIALSADGCCWHGLSCSWPFWVRCPRCSGRPPPCLISRQPCPRMIQGSTDVAVRIERVGHHHGASPLWNSLCCPCCCTAQTRRAQGRHAGAHVRLRLLSHLGGAGLRQARQVWLCHGGRLAPPCGDRGLGGALGLGAGSDEAGGRVTCRCGRLGGAAGFGGGQGSAMLLLMWRRGSDIRCQRLQWRARGCGACCCPKQVKAERRAARSGRAVRRWGLAQTGSQRTPLGAAHSCAAARALPGVEAVCRILQSQYL